jgi:hypothetical protein
MEPILVSDFKKNNVFVFSAGILRERTREGGVDYVDLNNNRQAEKKLTSFIHSQAVLTEPAFNRSFSEVERIAKENHTEVLTENDFKEGDLSKIKLEYPEFKVYIQDNGYILINKLRSSDCDIKALEKKECPNENINNLKWAIDVKDKEFIIYKPK